MKKRIIMIMLAVSMICTMASCGKAKDDDKKNSSRDREDDDDDDDKDEDKDDDKRDKDKREKDDQDKEDRDKDDRDKEEGHNDTRDNDDGDMRYEDDSDWYDDDEFVSANYYDEEKGELYVSDYDNNYIMTLYVPEGYEVSYASQSGAAFDLNSKEEYFDAISVDYRDSLYVSDYILYGTEPDSKSVHDYKVEYEEYEKKGQIFILATETFYDETFDYDYTYRYILVPYTADGEDEHVTITFVYRKTDQEIMKIAEEMLGL